MYKNKRKRSSKESYNFQEENKISKFRMENIKISEFNLPNEEINEEFSNNLAKKLSLNEIPFSPCFNLLNKNEIPFCENKKNMVNFWNELSEDTTNKIKKMDFVHIKEFKLDEYNDNSVKKNLFNDFNKKESFKLSGKFSFDNTNEKEEEEERLKKEEYYNKLINQVNLLEKFSIVNEKREDAYMEIDEEEVNFSEINEESN
jgi:hypothetical protein